MQPGAARQGILPGKPMRDTKSMAPVARFGDFEVAFEARELRKHGTRIRLEEKPFRILETLVENAGQVVKRETLHEKLWPDTFVAFDHNLNTAVNKLRNILGDPARRARFIETLPRRGYRFVAPVQWPGRDHLQVAANDASTSAQPPANAAERLFHPRIKATPVRRSSRPPRVRAPHLQAKNCQTAP